MKRVFAAVSAIAFGLTVFSVAQAAPMPHKAKQQAAPPANEKAGAPKGKYFTPEESVGHGSVSVEGHGIAYDSYAGILVVHAKDWDDAVQPSDADKDKDKEAGDKPAKPAAGDNNPDAEASMSYVAYFKRGGGNRPITFIYNGGPGSSTIWLHMGAFGPRRVVTSDDSHSPAAPYQLINNAYSLLDASDLVFIDAPGTGFGRLAGKDKEKAFWGVDEDANAFANFITNFLTKYGRWNSPKYLFGESYGTTRSANLINVLETDRSVDFNGVILLSQILAFDASADAPEFNPGVDLPYQLALPTYAATAWYHHKLPNYNGPLQPLLDQVEHFAMNEYALALYAGAMLPPDQRDAIAEKLHEYTGLPVDYIKKADLRVNGGEFEKTLLGDTDTTTGRLDTRFSGPTIDPLSEESDYDPQSAAISSAYVTAFNDYVRKDLHYGYNKTFKPEIDVFKDWNNKHTPPGAQSGLPTAPNVMPDLASAMKYNPDLKILLNAGYYDLATPFFEGMYEMKHLPIPPKLQGNIRFRFYESGHMVYAHEPALKQLHDNVAAFIHDTDHAHGK
jgi:carboxypeptidase C (cathepsin A)